MTKIGLIGGSGLDDPDILKESSDLEVDTPYGKPSSPLKIGRINDVEVVLLARHGREHTIPPTQVNFRANIHALKEAGCTHILATTAVGSLRQEIERGDLVIVNQFIDFTRHRNITFKEAFEPHKPEHTPMAEPFDSQLRNILINSCKELNLKHHSSGTVITIEGPRFSTKAESHMFRSFGADVINMSIAPEAALANEAGIPYAAIAMSTDYDCWKEDEEPVTWEEILKVFGENVSKVTSLLINTIPKINNGLHTSIPKRKIVLASRSPRRKQILEQHYDVTVDVSEVDEEAVKKDDVKELVMELAKLKAQTVAERHKNSVIVAADTLVYFEGEEIGQAKNEEEALEIIKRLSGNTHEVFSGICVVNTATGEILQDSEVSYVTFKNISDDDLKEYIASGQYKGKAGAYNVDDPEFEHFVDNVKGCKLNVKGMPLEKMKKMIKTLEKIIPENTSNIDIIKSKIKTYSNWPKEGIMFRDINSLLNDQDGLNLLTEELVKRYQDMDIDVIAGIESRGFITGSLLAHQLKKKFVLIRKPGKLPGETISQEYTLEYGTDKVEIQKHTIQPGDKVLLVDDLVATGGTCLASAQLIKKLGGEIVECSFVIDLPEVGGKQKLLDNGLNVFSLVDFEGE